MASRKTKHKKTSTPEGSAGRSFVYFSGCQRPENRLEKLQDVCKWRPIKPADSPNRMEDSFQPSV